MVAREFRKKNIKELIDHPLLAYSISACKMAGSIGRVIVSTDRQEIADVALKYGAEVPFIRPPELATDDSKDIDVIEHYFELRFFSSNNRVRRYRKDRCGICKGRVNSCVCFAIRRRRNPSAFAKETPNR